MADNEKTKELNFEKELACNVYVSYNDSYLVHRRTGHWGKTYCNRESHDLSSYYKKGTQYSDICKECLKSYSMEEIKLLKHFLIVKKLKGK